MTDKVQEYLRENELPSLYGFAKHYKTSKASIIASLIEEDICSSEEDSAMYLGGRKLLKFETTNNLK